MDWPILIFAAIVFFSVLFFVILYLTNVLSKKHDKESIIYLIRIVNKKINELNWDKIQGSLKQTDVEKEFESFLDDEFYKIIPSVSNFPSKDQILGLSDQESEIYDALKLSFDLRRQTKSLNYAKTSLIGLLKESKLI